jgi:hypothetical protein
MTTKDQKDLYMKIAINIFDVTSAEFNGESSLFELREPIIFCWLSPQRISLFTIFKVLPLPAGQA